MERQCLVCEITFVVDNRGNKHKKYCSISCANSNRSLSKESRKKISESLKNKVNWEQKYYTNPKKCIICKEPIPYKSRHVRKTCSTKCLKEWKSEYMPKALKGVPGVGGVRKGSGRGKRGWYKNVWCDSSWELAVVIFCLEHNKPIERCKETFEYIFEGKTQTYHPDFIIDGKIVEIKGFWTEKEKAKVSQATKEIEIIDEISIIPYIKYATEKYGKDFVLLYGTE